MRIQLASDLHLEFLHEHPGYRVVELVDDVDVLVLAGDIGVGLQALDAFADWPARHIVYVPGNHEFYRADTWEGMRARLRRAAKGSRIKLLDNEQVILDGVRFLGSTLWTDFDYRTTTRNLAMAQVERTLGDYRAITTELGPLRAKDTLRDHLNSRAWLESMLHQRWDGPTVVVTHHGPHPLSVHPRWSGSVVNAGFVSDLTPLLSEADLWLHGHVHDSFDYRVAGCRVVANPAGYALNMMSARASSDLRFENPAFNPRLVLELTSGREL